MNIATIVQARISSTRLPGKILLQMGNKTMLEQVITRLSQVKQINQIVVATSTDSSDDPIITLCQKRQYRYYRGSSTDVLSRYYEAAKKYSADIIIRITSDNPLIDSGLIDEGLSLFLQGNFDYVANKVDPFYVIGFEYEIMTFAALRKAYLNATTEAEHEHVTPYIWHTHPGEFKIKKFPYTSITKKYRLAVDTPEDFNLVKILIEKYAADIKSFTDIIKILETNPHLTNINKHIEQKQLGK